MSGIQVSGLLANSAFDWKSVVDQLVAAEGIPIKGLNKDKDTNTDKVTALADIYTSLQAVQDSLQSMRSGDVFSSRTVASDTANTTWKATSVTGAAIGSYKVTVQQLASAAQLKGAANVGAALSDGSDLASLTLANLRTATAVTAGVFTVNGSQVTIATTDSVQDVFDKISTATGGHVTASYSPGADGISLTSDNGELVLGASNDTSNFLSAFKLHNNGTDTAASSASLGVLTLNAPLTSAGLATSLTGSGGSFTVNGATISYSNTDTLSVVLKRITQSTAGVTATYDSANDRVLLVNKTTGDSGIAASDTTGNFLAALGLTAATGGALVHGNDAKITINDGPVLLSASNTLDASVHGIAGLSVTVNSETTQTLQVESDTATMSSALQSFIDKFNATQDLIETNTTVTSVGGVVTTSILSANRDVQEWAGQLQRLAFDTISGATGTVKRLDNLGIDFDSTSGHLTVKDTSKLATALGDHPEDVNTFFLNGSSGFVSKLYDYLTKIKAADRTQQHNLTNANTAIDDQIAVLQTRLDSQRELLTNSFMSMLDAQSKAQSQTTYLTNAFFSNNSN